jgi:hypothetical protein
MDERKLFSTVAPDGKRAEASLADLSILSVLIRQEEDQRSVADVSVRGNLIPEEIAANFLSWVSVHILGRKNSPPQEGRPMRNDEGQVITDRDRVASLKLIVSNADYARMARYSESDRRRLSKLLSLAEAEAKKD